MYTPTKRRYNASEKGKLAQRRYRAKRTAKNAARASDPLYLSLLATARRAKQAKEAKKASGLEVHFATLRDALERDYEAKRLALEHRFRQASQDGAQARREKVERERYAIRAAEILARREKAERAATLATVKRIMNKYNLLPE